MLSIELLELLTKNAKSYRADAKNSLKRNIHMHNAKDCCFRAQDIDAVLVDFINYVGFNHGIDYALYAEDLKKAE
jgi:hypothetical protein